MDALLRLSRESEEVRLALGTVNAWLARELERSIADVAHARTETRHGSEQGASDEAEHTVADGDQGQPASGAISDKILTPRHAARSPSPVEVESPRRERKSVDLARVVTRARWKAAACRLALDKRHAEREGRTEDPELARLEEALRRRREMLEDAWPWMLDAPPERPEDDRLADIAACYDTVALAAEKVLELEEVGAFRSGPPADVLYLLAESQSALLSALTFTDVRVDSDQRDVFLWLKDQTTRHRIYVDRHMRLEDPADSRGSADLEARLRVTVDSLVARQRARRQRGQLLNKVRYHVRKLLDGGALSDGEWSSIAGAVERWREAGLPLNDRALVELMAPLTPERTAGREAPPALAEVLRDVASGGSESRPARADDAPDPCAGEPASQSASEAASQSASLAADPGTPTPQSDPVAEVAPLLEGKRAALLGGPVDEAQRAELQRALRLGALEWIELDLDASEEVRRVALEEAIANEDVEIFFMGLRLPSEEYASFKDGCLARNLPFVRLPGALLPRAVAHQALRQVGWRLRAARDETVR